MALKMILFDLDGTLLPLDMEAFSRGYFSLLTAKAAPCGYEPKDLIQAVWQGTAAMVANDGSCTNEAAFWRTFAAIYGERALKDKPIFDEFYRKEFLQAKQFCGFNPKAKETVDWMRHQGLRLALATNPLFPAPATEARIRWAGLAPEDFEFCTTYENIGYAKPNPAYYRTLLQWADVPPEHCLMVGNDAEEDMAAQTIGMQVFLLTDCLINRHSVRIDQYPHGDFDQLVRHVKGLLP